MDLNDDGYGDILSGSYSRMGRPMAGLFQVLWGQSDGTFKKAEELTGSDGEPLIIPIEDTDSRVSLENICTRPTAVDWDDDGDLDLVVGNFGGSFYVFLGEGGGRFEPVPQPLSSGEELLRIKGHHSDPFLVDWDGDGDLDLLSGSSDGGVQWAENTAEAGMVPDLVSFESLIESGSQFDFDQLLRETELTGPTTSTRIYVDDVNADGKLDILVGDSTRLTSPAEGLTEDEYKEMHTAWQEAVRDASLEFDALKMNKDKNAEAEESASLISKLFSFLQPKSDLEHAQDRLNKLYRQRSEFIKQDATGFVWVYLQK